MPDTQSTSATPPGVPVTADNFNRAESDMYFGGTIKRAGGIGKFFTAAKSPRSTIKA